MKKVLVSFASSDLWRSVNRLKKQALALEVFDKIYIYTEKDLDEEFVNHFKTQLRFGSRGYGYWSWKPQVILQTLAKLQEGDVLLYVDVGCHLRIAGKKRLQEYFELARQYGVVAFQSKPLWGNPEEKNDINLEYQWVKGDLLDYFGVRSDKTVTQTGIIGATIFLIKKTIKNTELFEQFLEVFKQDFKLIDDSPSNSPNLPGFIEHRHDQSIWAILCKKNQVFTLSAFEYTYPAKVGLLRNWGMLKNYPIWAIRDRDYGFFKNFIRSKYLRSLHWKDFFSLVFYKTCVSYTYFKIIKLINR